jgi:hypothetical protein
MMRPLKILLVSLFAVSTMLGFASDRAAGKPGVRHALKADSMRFVYREFEGSLETVCKHRLQSADSPYDWKVECYNGSTKFADYTAHVALTQYDLGGETKYSIELLYWLTGTRLPSEVGSTTWYHFATKSQLQGISQSQTVDGGTAGLYLEIGAAAIRLSNWAR